MKLSKRGKVLIVIIGILTVLSLNFFQKEVKGFFYFISSPIQRNLWQAGDDISDFFEGIFKAGNLKKESEDSNLRIRELLAENISLKELEKENQGLREALEVGLQKNFRLALADVIGKDTSGDAFLINMGLRDGLLEGMPVITSQKVLLGKVAQVYDSFSYVSLISDKESSFDAKISDTKTTGVVKGKGNLKLELDLISQDKEVNPGDFIVSTALGGVYPKGILVGSIKEVERSDIQPFYKISVFPFFNIQELESVFIILNF